MLRPTLAALALTALACADPQVTLHSPPFEGVAVANPPPAAAAAPPAAPATHRLLGVLDPDRGNMVAFALKVPVGWETHQTFSRRWDGAVPTPQIELRLRAPDGSAEIVYRPLVTHTFSEGPMTDQLRAQRRQWGIDPRMADNELAPMPAAAYARQVTVPLLAREGLVLTNLRNDQEAPEERPSAEQTLRRGSVDGTLPDGRSARVECREQIATRVINGERYTQWTVVASITTARGDLEAAHAQTRIAQESIISNPAWQQAERESAQKGYQMNSDVSRREHEATMDGMRQNSAAMTAAHEKRMADIQRQGDANTAQFNDRMAGMDQQQAAYMDQSASQDRQQAYAIDGIREESRYADPTTGERVKVADGSENVYRANDGLSLGNSVLLATDAPLDPQQVDWVQLQKLTAQEY